MEKQAWEIFNELEPRYLKSYEALNGKQIESIEYKMGYVRYKTEFFVSKVRVSKFLLMTQELERRLAEKK